jgi:DNA ligase (NAD+)
VLTPVAELAPVELAGTTVARATLHNRDEIARQDIRVGDVVVVEKAGEIVPAITGVKKERREAASQAYRFPEACPACGTAVEQRLGEVAIRCPNFDCPAQVRRRIEHFASADAVAIAGLGPATIAALVDRKLIRDASDLFRLQRADLLASGRSDGPSIDRLLGAIEASKRAELWRFIYGIGIPEVGAVASQVAARQFGSLAALAVADGEEDAISRAITGYFAEPRNRVMLERLIAAGVSPGRNQTSNGALAGKVFVLTGSLPTLTRAQVTQRIEIAGGKVVETVNRATHYVVAGRDPGSKLEQARALGVEIIDEAALIPMLADPAQP